VTAASRSSVHRGTRPHIVSSGRSVPSDAASAPVDPREIRADPDARRPVLGHTWRVVRPYRFVDHRGEVEVELQATSEAGLFEAALAAFAELVSPGEQGDAVRHEIELAGDDRALLLADWLGELVFLAEVEQFVPERLAAIELAGDRLRATVAGRRDHPRELVKAVTLNGLEFERRGQVWHGRVVLDV